MIDDNNFRNVARKAIADRDAMFEGKKKVVFGKDLFDLFDLLVKAADHVIGGVRDLLDLHEVD